MQVKHIALAVAAVIAAPSAMATALTATNVFYVSGATAQTPGLAKSISNFCAVPVQAFTDDVDGATGFVYNCTNANAASGLTVGSSFIVVKNEGGSSKGVAPVANATAVAFPNIANCTIGAAVPATYNSADVVGAPAGTCATAGTTGASVVPNIGFSDVPNSVWAARGVAFTAANLVTAINFAGQGFGVAVSDALYTQMQNDQILQGTLATTCTGVTTPGDCQPSIGKEQYAAIITSNPGNRYQQDWSALLPKVSAGLPFTDPFYLNVVSICRRSSGSGTEASTEAYFLNTPCNAGTKLGGALTPVAGGVYDIGGVAGATAATATMVVTEAASTGAVKTCLMNSAIATGVSSPWAIGVMSLENPQPATGWKWLKLNGVSPNIDAYQKSNTVKGFYDFAYETEMLYNTSASAATKAFAAAMKKELGNGSNLATFPGIYADPSSGSTYVDGQTHKGSRNNNVCQPHQLAN